MQFLQNIITVRGLKSHLSYFFPIEKEKKRNGALRNLNIAYIEVQTY